MLIRWLGALALATGLALLPSAADAQVRFANTGGFMPGPGGYGGYPMGSPWGNSGGGSPAWGGGGWNNPYYNSFSGWTTYPGVFSVSTDPPPRTRPTLSPAVAVSPKALHPRSQSDPAAGSEPTPDASKSPIREVGYKAETGEADRRARIIVQVPSANAELWFDDIQVGRSGMEREYVTPPLEGNTKYSYEVRMRWTDMTGKAHNVSQSVAFRAGDRIRVDLTERAELLPAPKPKN